MRILALLLLPPLAWSQTAPGTSSILVEEGRKAYAANCAACHGSDAEGSDQGPALAGNRRLRARSAQQIRAFIYQGRPSSGMPAFHLPGPQLDALTAFVHSLNSPAAESSPPGSAPAGERYVMETGRCLACHMILGKGAAVGPDLSEAGRELSVSDLRESLLNPSAHLSPGYQIVVVRLRNGGTMRGFARARSNFDLQLQDLDGRFHMLRQDQIADLREERQSLMPAFSGSPEELRDVIAYLSTLTGVQPGAPAEPAREQRSGAADIGFARIRNPEPGDWLTYNGNLDGNRYSPLTQINASNVSRLRVQWVFPIDHFGLEVTPLVADGIMYITGPNQVLALDAATGRMIWKYSRPRTPGLIGDASLGTNRGVAVLGDKVFMMTDNAHLIALNRVTGSLVWEVVTPEEQQHYGSTVAPLAVKDTIIAGVSGGDRGIRGFLACYKAATGERLWRRWTIPLKGEPGSETWGSKEPLFGGGATWLTGAYDPATDTLYWPTGNPYPDSDDHDRPGDNLFSNCILALDPQTGALKWHYQFTPHDVHDWDATEPPVLVDTEYHGRKRKLLLHADRNGFFYVLDREEGQVLLATQFVRRLTWARGIGPDGRPQLLPETDSAEDCPMNAANWNSAAYSPSTRLYYVLTLEECRASRQPGAWKSAAPEEAPQKVLRAINIDTGDVAWEIPQIGSVYPKTWPGILATAGGLVFYGDPNGAFAAAGQRDGKVLWHFPTNVYMKASPMTYMLAGKQYVAVAAGPNILCFGLSSD
ncbi:MAG TPA: PQQ-binding-like beta-propeller repeat protein [Bryobacteraceae bacterium]|nr:PQQ-binding-like beta-propeller repeat protein [Bryobacteraceae bacterium]